MDQLEADVKLQEGMQTILAEQPYHSDSETKKKTRKLVFVDSPREQKELGQKGVVSRRDQDQDQDVDDEVREEDKDQIENREGSFAQQQQLRQNTTLKQKHKSAKQLKAEQQALVEMRAARKLKRRAAQVRLNKLTALHRQHADVTAAERELDWQRGRMTNSVGGINKYGLKWKIRERKK
jgi:U3 small nucleolar RNA-associated protein 11